MDEWEGVDGWVVGQVGAWPDVWLLVWKDENIFNCCLLKNIHVRNFGFLAEIRCLKSARTH